VIDAVIIGSGPAGAQAAKVVVDAGLSVQMLDFGNDDAAGRASVPDAPFPALRRSDPQQHWYFLDPDLGQERPVNDRVGAHFTPPRRFITRDVEEHLSLVSSTFAPVQSLALGGLGAGWGAGAPTYDDVELQHAGLPASAMRRFYDEVTADIGVTTAHDVDDNARALLRAFHKRHGAFRASRFELGPAPLAMLTTPLERDGVRREANPYTDMDFYGEVRGSIYRPRYTIDELRTRPNFTYRPGLLVESFEAGEDGVDVRARDASGNTRCVRAKRAILAAGAIGSARIALRSLGIHRTRIPLLCNPMTYLVCVNRATFGSAVSERRHSLAQLLGTMQPEHRDGQRIAASFYSYSSLLLYRLVREMPLPVWLGVPLARLLLTGLGIVGLHHPEVPSPEKWLALDGEIMRAGYESGAAELQAIRRDVAMMSTVLLRLGCVPISRTATPPGSSIHYAGTMPNDERAVLATDGGGRIRRAKRVFVADAATWRGLPAKGPTLTIMANARRVATELVHEHRSAM
jgi:choline dehydrogenase-like flavoprotein